MTHTAHTALVFLGLVRLASLVPLLFLPLPCLTTMAKQNKWIIDLYQLLSTICINYETNICYILQKVKSSTNIYYGFRVEPSLHTFIQLVIEAFTSRETWTRSLDGGQWQTCSVFLEARDDSNTAKCTICRNFPNIEFDC